jgi:hypothetical protein
LVAVRALHRAERVGKEGDELARPLRLVRGGPLYTSPDSALNWISWRQGVRETDQRRHPLGALGGFSPREVGHTDGKTLVTRGASATMMTLGHAIVPHQKLIEALE